MDLVNLLNNLNNQNNETNENVLRNFYFLQENVYGKRKYTVFPRIDPFERFDEEEFRDRFRLNKDQVNALYNTIDGDNTLEPMAQLVSYTTCYSKKMVQEFVLKQKYKHKLIFQINMNNRVNKIQIFVFKIILSINTSIIKHKHHFL